ncbi:MULTISPECIES: GPW/gp25 family protein [unclassified Neisseria]|uniref:GPW/gp25 family protein n=1 Tax=unclassified Neisseria TaxID=2623750 RepID=UPI001071BDBD|nr:MULTISPECIES: GPW/gp25 family protein [unclassified Neisseria]MBF0802895.1 GPW/gp25 family protein [Neisseria sp. 19428wB4_WF04]TFU44430.1 phage baseplate protein [Neisseria sp. WF04]
MHFQTPVSKHWQLAPEGGGLVQGADDINLCILNILSTRKGSDVTRPAFGSNHFDYIDTPEDVFVPNAVREVMLAVNTWEKRAVVERVGFENRAPHIVMTVFWRVAQDVSGEIYSTAVNVERAAWI